MRLLLSDHLSNAYQSLRSNRLRTFLTGLGVTIGVASITAILSLSAGVSGVIQDQIDALEGNIAVVRPGAPSSDSSFINQQGFATSTLSEADYTAIEKLPNVQTVTPLMVVSGSTSSKDRTQTGANIIGTTPELQDIAGLTIRDGQFIDRITNQQTAVIGRQLSIDLFGTEQSVGKTFTIRGDRFIVIGVLKKLGDPLNFNNVNFDNAAIVHIQAAKQFNQGSTQIQQLNVQAKSVAALPEVIRSIDALLKESHGGEQDYSILSGKDIAAPTSKLFTVVQSVTIAIASISLLVGGIGIMNIMLVSVAERTREIGLRKAIGASNAHIVWQFLIESLIIGISGGIAGYVAGYVTAFIISSFLTFDPVFTLEIAGVAFGLSIIVGVLFGLYPALRASRKDPIESLRQFH